MFYFAENTPVQSMLVIMKKKKQPRIYLPNVKFPLLF